MSTNCLITKLKGTVNNDSLPIFNKVYASVDPAALYRSSSLTFQIATGNLPIHVKSKVPFICYGTSEKVTEYTIKANSDAYGTISVSDVPSDSYYEDIIEFDNYYTCSMFYFIGTITSGINAPIDIKSNYSSMLKYAPLEIVSLNKADIDRDLSDSIYYVLTYSDSRNPIECGNLFNLPNIEVIKGTLYSSSANIYGNIYISGNNNYNDSNAMYLDLNFNGSITNLPYGTKLVNSRGMQGNIEDFVAMATAKGRTSGALVLRTAGTYGTALLFEGTDLVTLANNGSIPLIDSDKNVCFTWDSTGNISFVSTLPEGYLVNIPSPAAYYQNKHSNN